MPSQPQRPVSVSPIVFRATYLLCLAFPLFAIGCNNGPKMVKVTGDVSYEGKPVESGEIIFLSTDPAFGPDAGPIANGRFEFMAKTGSKRVEIRGTKQVAMTAMGPLMKEFIPLEFNADSKLTAEVTPAGPNQFDFGSTPSKKK